MSSKRSRKTNRDDERVFIGSGNIFADLERRDSNEALAKVQLAYRVHQLIAHAGMTQAQAAKRLGVDQPKISNLMRGRLKDFSIERLLRFLNLLGQDVELRVIGAKRAPGGLKVYAKAS